MARKSNSQLRRQFGHVLELRKGNRAQPVPAADPFLDEDDDIAEGLADYWSEQEAS